MRHLSILITCLFCGNLLFSQEGLTPLSCNFNYFYRDLAPAQKAEGDQTAKKKAASLFLPFLEDFYYASTSKYPSLKLWEDSLVYVNTGFPIAPPSIGVATFDGLNKHGYPYLNPPAPNLSISGPADTLTSKPINLFQSATNQTLVPADKVGLSFFYQARGRGEPPEQNDSLILDLKMPKQNTWKSRVWAVRGNNNPNLIDTAFKRVFIKIPDTAYFHDGFQFRFRNKATNTGNFDHWHLDYIQLDQGRDSIGDTLFNDVTFAHVPTSFLKDYSAMPFQQYVSSEMATSNSVMLKNNFTASVNIIYENRFYRNTTQTYSYSAGATNIAPFKYFGYLNNYAFSNPASHPNFSYQYPYPMTDSTDFTIKHYIYRNNSGNDLISANDTVYQYQRFRNYYAYDDGSPEAGYYVLGAGGRMAVKIRVNVKDTLRAVRIYFDPAPIGAAKNFNFRIQVWNGTSAPSASIAGVDYTFSPQFLSTGFKDIPEFTLPQPLALNPGTYFVVLQQQVSTGLVVGFDRNYDTRQTLFFDSGSGWTQSSLKGALMMRPVMGSKIIPVGLRDNGSLYSKNFSVYPNPSDGVFSIRSENTAHASYEIMNSLGQAVHAGTLAAPDETVNTAGFPTGIYILKIVENGAITYQQKIIIQK